MNAENISAINELLSNPWVALELARRNCLKSTLFFTQYNFEKIKREQFIVNEHHRIIADALDKVFSGEITRLIINIAPRYTKTEMAVKNFIAKGLAHNPKAKFIHLSYSDSLALDNSNSIRDTCKDQNYQQLFPEVQISPTSDSKKKWYTTMGGGVYATAAGGQVTGFGAGAIDHSEDSLTEDEDLKFLIEAVSELDNAYENPEPNDGSWQKPFADFSGAVIIDDSIKPEDALSEIKRRRVNNQFDSTIRNRVNSKRTPIVIIGQRVHEDDLTGHLLKTEPEKWVVIKLPCLKEDGTALWNLKHTVDDLLHLKKVSPYVFECQYQQDPKPVKRGGEFYKLFVYTANVIKNPLNKNTGKPLLYDPDVALHVTYDFNVIPYLAIGIWQIWIDALKNKRAIKIDEIPSRSPANRAGPASEALFKRYHDHGSGLFVYGDPSGKQEDTRTEQGVNDFVLISRVLKPLKPQMRLLSKAPSVSMRGNFINGIFTGGVLKLEILIGDNCTESINDYMYLKEDSDGTKLKEMTKDAITLQQYQKYGHFSDGDDYFICTAFAAEYAAFQSGPGGKLSTGKATPSKNTY